MTEICANAPDGFEGLDTGCGFSSVFGPLNAANDDRPVIAFRVAERHPIELATCHGRAMATFADMQTFALRNVRAVQGQPTPMITLSVDYIASTRLGGWVEAHATLTKKTNREPFIDSTIFTDGAIAVRTGAFMLHPCPKGTSRRRSDGNPIR